MANYRSSQRSSIRTTFIVLYILAAVYIRTANCCNKSSLGISACVRISRYSGEQWSTCVTDLYIRQKSKGRHGCAEGQANCIYQCMLEVHDANSGKVSSPCTCSTLDGLNTDTGMAEKTVKPTVILPSWCFTPTGADCSWFKTCLEKRYYCGAKFKGEIIKFAEELCGLYLNPYSDLSKSGNMWINGARKCLQVTLVPLLRKWHGKNDQSCESLTKHAISSYSHCFYSPFPATIPAICELPLTDLWRIFWHLRQTLVNEKVQYSLLALLRSIENCNEFQKVDLNEGKVRKLVFHVERHEVLGQLQEGTFLSEELGQKIAKHFCLDKEGIVWFAYPKIGSTFTNNTSEFVFYIADKREHRMSQELGADPIVNLNNTVLTLVDAVRRNELCFRGSGAKQDYRITATTVCHDLECRRNTWKVQADNSVALASNGSPIIGPISCLLTIAQFVIYLARLNL